MVSRTDGRRRQLQSTRSEERDTALADLSETGWVIGDSAAVAPAAAVETAIVSVVDVSPHTGEERGGLIGV